MENQLSFPIEAFAAAATDYDKLEILKWWWHDLALLVTVDIVQARDAQTTEGSQFVSSPPWE